MASTRIAEPAVAAVASSAPTQAPQTTSSSPSAAVQEPAAPQPAKAGKKKSNMLRSTLNIEDGLKDYWYPVEFSKVPGSPF